MKTIPLFILLAALCCTLPSTRLHAQEAQELRVLDPMVGKANTDLIAIEEITCTPAATTLRLDAYHRKGCWIQLSSDIRLKGHTTGKTYKLLRPEGFELDRRVAMPASGNIRFQLVFEPLDPLDTTLDLIEGHPSDGFRLEDISLTARRSGPILCHVEGTVAHRPEGSRLVLAPDNTDIRVHPFISIPVRNGKFRYDLRTSETECWELYFWHDHLNGSWMPCRFFSEDGTVRIHFPAEETPTVDSDTPENARMRVFNHKCDSLYRPRQRALAMQQDSLMQAGAYYTPAFHAYYARFDSLVRNEAARLQAFAERDSLEASGVFYTQAARAWKARHTQLREEQYRWTARQTALHPSLHGLWTIQDNLAASWVPQTAKLHFQRAYEQAYTRLYTRHPYHARILRSLAAQKLRVGLPYPGCTASNADGHPVDIGQLIRGRIALVDFWASWCGSCRLNAKQMIPVYERFKDRGFTVVGIAREQNQADMEQAARQDGYPWTLLLELNDEHQLWNKHGLGNGGGGTFLIDRDGTILAINPSAGQVERILQNKLGKQSESTPG